MSPVNDNRDSLRPRHLHHCTHRQDLAGDIDHVAHQDQFGLRRDVAFKEGDDLIRVLGGDRNRELAQHNPLAPLALEESSNHPGIVLIGGQHLVARSQIETELANLQAFRGVARQGDLFGITAELAPETLAHRFSLRLENLPHTVGWCGVGIIQVPLHRLLDPSGGRAHPAVVEVNQAAVHGERLAHLKPEVFVTRGLLRSRVFARALPQGAQRVRHAFQIERRTRCGGGHGNSQCAQEPTPAVHGFTSRGTSCVRYAAGTPRASGCPAALFLSSFGLAAPVGKPIRRERLFASCWPVRVPDVQHSLPRAV